LKRQIVDFSFVCGCRNAKSGGYHVDAGRPVTLHFVNDGAVKETQIGAHLYHKNSTKPFVVIATSGGGRVTQFCHAKTHFFTNNRRGHFNVRTNKLQIYAQSLQTKPDPNAAENEIKALRELELQEQQHQVEVLKAQIRKEENARKLEQAKIDAWAQTQASSSQASSSQMQAQVQTQVQAQMQAQLQAHIHAQRTTPAQVQAQVQAQMQAAQMQAQMRVQAQPQAVQPQAVQPQAVQPQAVQGTHASASATSVVPPLGLVSIDANGMMEVLQLATTTFAKLKVALFNRADHPMVSDDLIIEHKVVDIKSFKWAFRNTGQLIPNQDDLEYAYRLFDPLYYHHSSNSLSNLVSQNQGVDKSYRHSPLRFYARRNLIVDFATLMALEIDPVTNDVLKHVPVIRRFPCGYVSIDRFQGETLEEERRVKELLAFPNYPQHWPVETIKLAITTKQSQQVTLPLHQVPTPWARELEVHNDCDCDSTLVTINVAPAQYVASYYAGFGLPGAKRCIGYHSTNAKNEVSILRCGLQDLGGHAALGRGVYLAHKPTEALKYGNPNRVAGVRPSGQPASADGVIPPLFVVTYYLGNNTVYGNSHAYFSGAGGNPDPSAAPACFQVASNLVIGADAAVNDVLFPNYVVVSNMYTYVEACVKIVKKKKVN
jgi:hypothetical protein